MIICPSGENGGRNCGNACVNVAHKRATSTLSGKISVRREALDGDDRNESIALVLVEERSIAR